MGPVKDLHWALEDLLKGYVGLCRALQRVAEQTRKNDKKQGKQRATRKNNELKHSFNRFSIRRGGLRPPRTPPATRGGATEPLPDYTIGKYGKKAMKTR